MYCYKSPPHTSTTKTKCYIQTLSQSKLTFQTLTTQKQGDTGTLSIKTHVSNTESTKTKCYRRSIDRNLRFKNRKQKQRLMYRHSPDRNSRFKHRKHKKDTKEEYDADNGRQQIIVLPRLGLLERSRLNIVN